QGTGLVLRARGAEDLPPLFRLPQFRFDIDLGLLSEPVKSIARVETNFMEINVPPKGRRKFRNQQDNQRSANGGNGVSVVIAETVVTKTVLQLLPADPAKKPLRFDIEHLVLKDAGPQTAMTYQAELTNPKPPGLINAKGGFGPWNTEEPGDTNLSGDYTFDNA